MKDANTHFEQVYADNVAKFETLQEKKSRDMNDYIEEVLGDHEQALDLLRMDQSEETDFFQVFIALLKARSYRQINGKEDIQSLIELGRHFEKFLISKIEWDFNCQDLSEYGE